MSAIDLRSDTVTRPSAAMRRAIADAEVGDDVLDGDPTVRRLEQRVAELVGMEDALFFPSGTQANQTGVALCAERGTELVLEANAHLVHYELAHSAAMNVSPHTRYAIFFRLTHVDHDPVAVTDYIDREDLKSTASLTGQTYADADIDRFGTVERGGLRPVAIVERPGAGGADRNRAGQPGHDRMIDRRQVAFLDVVAGAGLADAAGEIDAKPVHGVARPAAAVALQFQRLFGGQHAAATRGLDMEGEIALFPEQAKTVADLPGNLQGPVGRGLRFRP